MLSVKVLHSSKRIMTSGVLIHGCHTLSGGYNPKTQGDHQNSSKRSTNRKPLLNVMKEVFLYSTEHKSYFGDHPLPTTIPETPLSLMGSFRNCSCSHVCIFCLIRDIRLFIIMIKLCKKCTSLRGEDKVPHKCMKNREGLGSNPVHGMLPGLDELVQR